MIILQIEHAVPNFDGWKQAFDRDPINRKRSGVRRYHIFRPTDDPKYVLVHLEFDTLRDAETTLAALRTLWGRVEGVMMFNPHTRILNVVETVDIT